jgi:Spy/CpxP family protein refolding chaperone
MRDSIQVSGKQLQQYTQRYDSHMSATKPSRDSLRISMQAVRAAFESGNRSEARARRETVKRQWKQLAERDQKFEEGLNDVLTKDQQARYQQWKEKRKQEARDRRRHGRRADGRHRGWTTLRHDSTNASPQPFDSGKALTR